MRSSTLLAVAFASFAAAQVNDAKKTTSSTTAAATTAPTACSATVNQPAPTGVTCDKSGTLKTPAYYGGAFGEVNRDACAAVCATIEGCNSFQYNQGMLAMWGHYGSLLTYLSRSKHLPALLADTAADGLQGRQGQWCRVLRPRLLRLCTYAHHH